jgi:hypothetical protein
VNENWKMEGKVAPLKFGWIFWIWNGIRRGKSAENADKWEEKG